MSLFLQSYQQASSLSRVAVSPSPQLPSVESKVFNAHTSHPDLLHLVLLVFEAVLEVVCVSLPGYIIARQGLFNSDMQKFAANLNVMLFTPCLIFTKLASQLTLEKLADLAIIPLIFVVQTLVSLTCSTLISRLFRFNKRKRNFVTAMGVFGNSNSLPISLVISLSQTIKGLHWTKIPADNDDDVAARGILYLLIFQQLGQLLRWSWGYNVLLAPDTHPSLEEDVPRYRDDEEAISHDSAEIIPPTSCIAEPNDISDLPAIREDLSSIHVSKTSGPSCLPILSNSGNDNGRESSVTSSIRRNFSSETTSSDHASKTSSDPGSSSSSTHHTGELPADESKFLKGLSRSPLQWCRRLRPAALRLLLSIFHSLPTKLQTCVIRVVHVVRTIAKGIMEFMNPPLWAMLAAILVASFPRLQHLFFDEGSFVKNSVTSAISQSGGVAVPLILVVLGGNLARNTLPVESKTIVDPGEERKLLIACLLSRMFFPTLIIAPLIAIMAKYVPISILEDPIFVIVCFLITGAPSALQLAQICQLNNVFVSTMSKLLFHSYVVWILPSTLVLVMCALEVVEWAQQI